MIIEVGMGGLLDATNVMLNPLACILTSVSLDHQEHLGSTISSILRHKLAIGRPDVPFFIALPSCTCNGRIEIAVSSACVLDEFSHDIDHFKETVQSLCPSKEFHWIFPCAFVSFVEHGTKQIIKWKQNGSQGDTFQFTTSMLGKSQLINLSISLHVFVYLCDKLYLQTANNYLNIARTLQNLI